MSVGKFLKPREKGQRQIEMLGSMVIISMSNNMIVVQRPQKRLVHPPTDGTDQIEPTEYWLLEADQIRFHPCLGEFELSALGSSSTITHSLPPSLSRFWPDNWGLAPRTRLTPTVKPLWILMGFHDGSTSSPKNLTTHIRRMETTVTLVVIDQGVKFGILQDIFVKILLIQFLPYPSKDWLSKVEYLYSRDRGCLLIKTDSRQYPTDCFGSNGTGVMVLWSLVWPIEGVTPGMMGIPMELSTIVLTRHGIHRVTSDYLITVMNRPPSVIISQPLQTFTLTLILPDVFEDVDGVLFPGLGISRSVKRAMV